MNARAVRIIRASIVFCLCGAPAMAQSLTPTRVTIRHVERAPQLSDFIAMDASDSPVGMLKIEGFVQRFPNDGQPITERTIAYIGYDGSFLYAAFQCFDTEPGRIGAHLLQRDAFPDDEDTVAVQVDTFRDLKHAYGFQTNAYGVQTDGTYTEGAGWDLSWDTTWRTEATVTSRGYVVLISIPFKSLRFPPGDAQQWGLFFYRGIPRKNEEAFWPANSTRIATRWPQAALVDGIVHVSPGRNLQGIPYLSSRTLKTLDGASSDRLSFTRRADLAVGGDGKAVIHDSLVLDGTVNPDFSQVESDLPQVTVNKPFEVLFPEKRPFFLENETYFNTPVQLLFTRRIADPSVGGRATGRLGRYALGAMVVDDRSPADAGPADQRAWFGVARVIRDIGGESSVGLFASTRMRGSTTNRVGAADTRVRLGANWFATGQAVITDLTGTRSASTAGTAIATSLVGAGRRFNYELDYNDRSPAFRVVDGFIPRVDLRSIDQTYSFRARPRTGGLRAWGPDLVLNRTWDYEGRPLDYSVTPRFAWQWPGATNLDVYYTAARLTLRPSEVRSVGAPLETAANRIGFSLQSALFRRVIGSGTFFTGDGVNLTPAAGTTPQSARVIDATATASIRLSRSLILDVSSLFDRLHDGPTARVVYADRITRLRLAEQLTRSVAVRAIVEYKQLDVDSSRTALQPARNLNYDLLLTFLQSPGSAFYVGANYNLATVYPSFDTTAPGLQRSLTNTGWQVFTKASHLFRW